MSPSRPMASRQRVSRPMSRRLALPLAPSAAVVLAGMIAAGPAMAAPDGVTQRVTVDLGVTMTVSPATVIVGRDVTYEVVVSGPTDDVGRDVMAVVALDYQLALVSMTPTQGTCDLMYASCRFGAVSGGAPASVTVVARTTRTAVQLKTSVEVSTSDVDPNPDNDSATAVARVLVDAFGCTIVGSDADELLTGSEGHDVLCGRGGDDDLYSDDGGDELRGGDGVDELFAGGGDDLLLGGRGDDRLLSSPGDDEMNGGHGHDAVSYQYDSTGVTVDLGSGTAADGFGGHDHIRNAEVLYGSWNDDILHGSARRDTINGQPGDDLIFGHLRGDLLLGDDDDDTLDGGSGVDECDEGGEGGDDVLISCERLPARWVDRFTE